jgi:hypothetical protein
LNAWWTEREDARRATTYRAQLVAGLRASEASLEGSIALLKEAERWASEVARSFRAAAPPDSLGERLIGMTSGCA